ncbi:thiamine diphosphokinase [Bifidobacterium sp. 82T24]|uniref:thiamine diphosphokinase n=1 Tax=Bifidobacterium pluvialisilvae TaxID=2834436 RepID=UPI001C593466|nr:thiamine diphosphokinase [Bifidobacterium pluvialisilvae]MBW3087305.1 thiamine diphosphokinase [Bifidobacterium pluvialisilvae]
MDLDVCFIFGAGEYYDEVPAIPRGAYVIAADGGVDHTEPLGITPDAVIGDFDSAADDFAETSRYGDVMRLPSEKDDTDMFAAVKLGWAHGARRFHIFGGLGGRLDHTLANMQLLAQISRHAGIGLLHGDGMMATAITDATLSFPAWRLPQGVGRMVSVFAHSDAASHVSIRGLKYEVDDAQLRNTRALGVSNEFRDGVDALVTVGDGTLVVTYPTAAPEPTWHTSRAEEGPDALGAINTHVSHLLAR